MLPYTRQTVLSKLKIEQWNGGFFLESCIEVCGTVTALLVVKEARGFI